MKDRERERERERERQTDRQTDRGRSRELDVGLNPGGPGSRPEMKAGSRPLSHPGIAYISFFCVIPNLFISVL